MDGRFVGRAGELAQVKCLLERVTGGVGGVLLVIGEQGVGKSALLQHSLAAAEAAGCRVAWGVGNELEQRIPMGLMVECLGTEGRQAVEGGLPDGADGSGGGVAGVLSGDPVAAAAERLLGLVDRLCVVSPVVMVAEDLQWADEASLLVWRRLARAVGQLPLLLVGSLRPGVAGEAVDALVRGMVAGGGTVLELEPLPGSGVAELAEGLVGGRPGQRLLEVLGQAGGNPLYVGELVDALFRVGRVVMTGGVAELSGEPGEVRVPGSLQAAIEGRLAALPARTVGVLRWAAVLGGEFSVTDAGLVTGLAAGELATMMQLAVAAAVVAEMGAGIAAGTGSRLGFRHGLIRQVLYDGIPRPVREALHLEAARALAGAGVPAERVAAQLAAAPEACRDWVWTWLADGVGGLAHRAPQVAAQLLRQALGQVAETDPRREVLEAGLVQVAFLLVEDEEVERVARPLLARTRDAHRAAQVAWLLAYTLGRTSRDGEAAAVGEAALARPGLGEVWSARLRARQAMTLTVLGQWDQAAQMAAEALAGGELTGDRFAAGYALHAMSLVDGRRRDHVAGLNHIDRALAVIGDDRQTSDLRLLLLANRAFWLGNADRIAEADTTLRQALRLAEQAGTPRLAMIRAAAADHYFVLGQWDDALVVLETAREMPGPDSVSIVVDGLAALIAGHRDQWRTAKEHLAAVHDHVMSSPMYREIAYYLLLARALAAERAGRPGEAAAVLEPCLDPEVAEDMPDQYMLLPSLTRLALAADDAAMAAAAAQAAVQEAGREPMPIKVAAADLCRGLVDGDPGPVLAAADYYGSVGRPLDRAQGLEDVSALLAKRGDLPAARRAFAGAARLYHELGAEWDLRRADARLRRFGIRRGRSGQKARPAYGWQALTPTETKITSLVADGRSNPDIAAELFLSRNTVQTHISHILAKLGARSRAEIIRQALEHTGGPRTMDKLGLR